jgi:hypothetical protein
MSGHDLKKISECGCLVRCHHECDRLGLLATSLMHGEREIYPVAFRVTYLAGTTPIADRFLRRFNYHELLQRPLIEAHPQVTGAVDDVVDEMPLCVWLRKLALVKIAHSDFGRPLPTFGWDQRVRGRVRVTFTSEDFTFHSS